MLIALCVLSGLVLPAAQAADPVLFAAINDEILPLNPETMPKYYKQVLYLPFTYFSSDKLGIHFTTSGDLDKIMIFGSRKHLLFTISTGEIYDHTGQQHFFSVLSDSGTVYLPAQSVCDFFGLTLSVLKVYPGATIVRVKNAAAVFNDASFPYYIQTKSDMLRYWEEYNDAHATPSPSVSPTPGVSPSPGASPTPASPDGETYQRVTIYLSFFKLSGNAFGEVLDILGAAGYRCGFFVAADEIAENADLLRRAAGEGHTIGIWLKTGTYEEYLDGAGLLYEAAKVRTLLVAAPGDAAASAQAAAEKHGLIYWHSTRRYDESKTPSAAVVADKLSVLAGSRESLLFPCTDKAAVTVRGLVEYLQEKQYSVRKITETSAPTLTID